jgi:PAS domain S-box-containing protein
LILISFLAIYGLIEFTGAEQATGKLAQIVSFNVVGLLVVGLLASRLSDRRTSGEKLEETAKSLANLRLLHERIIESIRSGLITTDLDGTIYTFNAAATEITGYRSEDFRGGSIFTLFGDIHEPIRLSLNAAVEGEQSPRFETDLQTPGSEMRPWRLEIKRQPKKCQCRPFRRHRQASAPQTGIALNATIKDKTIDLRSNERGFIMIISASDGN